MIEDTGVLATGDPVEWYNRLAEMSVPLTEDQIKFCLNVRQAAAGDNDKERSWASSMAFYLVVDHHRHLQRQLDVKCRAVDDLQDILADETAQKAKYRAAANQNEKGLTTRPCDLEGAEAVFTGLTPDCPMCGAPNEYTAFVYSNRQDERRLLCAECFLLMGTEEDDG